MVVVAPLYDGDAIMPGPRSGAGKAAESHCRRYGRGGVLRAAAARREG